jgi:hypothetical protein
MNRLSLWMKAIDAEKRFALRADRQHSSLLV